jgi:signal transduction histidine kinase
MTELLTEQQIRALASHLTAKAFPELAKSLHSKIDVILLRWRKRTLESLPNLDRLSVEEFENSLAIILRNIANAMESDDPMKVADLIKHAPEHGYDRFLQKYSQHELLTEERLLRIVVIEELEKDMGRPATKVEALALHELIDIMSQVAILAMQNKLREEARDLADRLRRTEQLAGLGTLAAGIGHDLSNHLFPLGVYHEALRSMNLPPPANEYLDKLAIIAKQLSALVTNVRALASDPAGREHQAVDLRQWSNDFLKLVKASFNHPINVNCEVPDDAPPAAINDAALSQAVFNLVHNAAQALREQEDGRIVIHVRAPKQDTVQIIVEDNGPGMSPAVLQHSIDPFFTTRRRGVNPGSGLGLSLVHALVNHAGGKMEIHSPPLASERGTAVIIDLPVSKASQQHA